MENSRETEKSNIIFIGGKPFMNYITAVGMKLNQGQEAIINARGKFISKAIDIVEVVCRNFLKGNVQKKEITTSSKEFENKDGRKVFVSEIEIKLK